MASVESWALTSVDAAKEYMKVQGPVADEVIASLVNAATLACEFFAGRRLAARTYTREVYDGPGGCDLRLRNYPVTAVSEVRFLTSSAPETWTAYSTSDYGLYIAEPIKERIAFRSLDFPWGPQAVQVSYTAGFGTVAVSGINTDLPSDLATACKIVAHDLWRAKDRLNANIASQTMPGGQNVTYRNDELPVQAKQLLRPYLRWA